MQNNWNDITFPFPNLINKKMHRYPIKVLWFSTLIAIALAAGCRPQNSIEQFWSGTASFSIPIAHNNTLSFSYQTYNLTYISNADRRSILQYAFAIKDMAILSSDLFYFDLLVLKTSQSNLILNFIYEPNKWSLISYNYWLTFRSDMILGLTTYTSEHLSIEGENYQLSHKIPVRDANPSSYAVIVFLNGIRFNSPTANESYHLGFTLQAQYLKMNKLVIEFECPRTDNLLSLTFSFIVYQPESLPLVSYGGIINNQIFKSKNTKDLHYLLPNSNFHAIYGLSAIVAHKQSEGIFTFQSNLANNFLFTYGLKDWEELESIELTYIILGQAPQKLCQKAQECLSQGKLLIHNNQCLASCPITTKPFGYLDGSVECRDCPINMFYSPTTDKCQCFKEYTIDKYGKCIVDKISNGATHALAGSAEELVSSDLHSETNSFSEVQQCLKLSNIQQNSKNLFVTLKASPAILSDQHSIEKNYINLSFVDPQTAATSYYCTISETNVTEYNCLLLYSASLPTKTIQMKFQCAVTTSTGAKNCQLKIPYLSMKAK